MKRGTTLLSLLIAMTLSIVANAQPGWKWPEQEKDKAEEYNVLYSDAVKMQDWQTAIPPLQWLINKAPDLNKSLYVNGAKIYDNLAKVEKDAAKKADYVDSLMLMYDLRMKYFGDSVNVMNRKVFKAYRYYIKDYSKSEWLLEIFDKTYEISGDKVMDQNLLAYMNVIKVNKLAKKNLTDEQILERYDVISGVVERKVNALKAKNRGTDKITQQKEYVDKILTEIVDFDCNLIEENMGPRFKANPNDVNLVKRMFSFMLTGKCTDSDLFLEVSKQLQSLEPNYGLAKVIGNKCLVAGNYGCATQYFEEALTLTDDGTEKADVYINMGKLESKRNNKAAARANYRKALAADAGNKEPYVLIGDLYYHSFEECKKMEDMVQDRLVFIAAYEMYERGSDAAKMRSAKSQFPSTEEIFTNNYEKGQVMTVGCWISEAVKLDSRD
jgi:tetratricopeptide (TPR) repeat protein